MIGGLKMSVYNFDTYGLVFQSEPLPVDSNSPLNSQMDRNILGNLGVDSTWLDQCFLYQLDFRLHMTPKLCLTKRNKGFDNFKNV